MQIQTLNRSYEVLQRMESMEETELLIVRDNNRPELGKCMIAVLKKEENIHAFIPFCEEQRENFPFDDFLDYFPRDGCLYMVFKYYEYSSLKKRIEAGTPRKERLELVRSLLQRMVFLRLPVYLQTEALTEQNLLCDESGTVYFNFFLRNPDTLNTVCQGDVWDKLYVILKQIFAEEISDRSTPALETLITRLERKRYRNFLELLQEYEPLCRELLEKDEKKEIKPQSFGFRLWERLKKWMQKLKYVLMIAVLGVILWYLIDTIRNPEYQDGEKLDFQSIGTLEIVTNAGTETEDWESN